MSDTAPTMRDELRTGQTFAVRLAEGRWGACRVLHAGRIHSGRHQALIAAMAWWGTTPPTLDEPALRLLQRQTTPGGSGNLNRFWVRQDPLPEVLTYLGVLPSSPAESVRGEGIGYGDWDSFLARLAAQCAHDEAAGLALASSDAELRARARVAARRYGADRRKQALVKLSGDPFPPNAEGEEEEDAPAYRRILGETLAALLELGPEGDEVAKIDCLRRCVERFNLVEENIDTYLREVICDYFHDLVWVAGLEDYGEDLNCPWREF